MTFDEFKDKIYLGWMNQGTYIEITLYYVDRFNPTENKQKNIQIGLNPPVNKYLPLNIDIKILYQQCIPAMKYWYEELYNTSQQSNSNEHILENENINTNDLQNL